MKSIILLVLITVSFNAYSQNVNDTITQKESAKEHAITGTFITSVGLIGGLVNLTSAKPSSTLYYVCAGVGAVGVSYLTISYFKYRKLKKLRRMNLK